MDYYKMLAIDQSSTKEDIDSAYHQQLSKLNQAYNVLSDPESKKRYDQKYKLSLLDGFTNPFQNVITNIHNNFTDSLFPEISKQSQLPLETKTYQKSYSYHSEYDSTKGVNHIKKVVNDNGKQTVEEYDKLPKYIDSWGLIRED